MNQETNQETKRIEAYAIDDFVKQIQEAVLQGYRLNLEDNEKYPLQIGVGFYCTMDKKCVISATERQTIIQDAQESMKEPCQEYSQPVKRGRQPKG
jgi:hypothetical protein